MKTGEDTQRIIINEILDNHLPPNGVGTEREKLRMTLLNEIQVYVNQELTSLREQLKQKEDEIVRLKRAIELYKESLGIKD